MCVSQSLSGCGDVCVCVCVFSFLNQFVTSKKKSTRVYCIITLNLSFSFCLKVILACFQFIFIGALNQCDITDKGQNIAFCFSVN